MTKIFPIQPSIKLTARSFGVIDRMNGNYQGIVQLANPASLIVAEASLGEVETILVLAVDYATALE